MRYNCSNAENTARFLFILWRQRNVLCYVARTSIDYLPLVGSRTTPQPGRRSPRSRQFCDRKRIGVSCPTACHRKRRRGSGRTDGPPKYQKTTRSNSRVALLPRTTSPSHTTHRPLEDAGSSSDVNPRFRARTQTAESREITGGGTSVPVNDRGSSIDQEATRLEDHRDSRKCTCCWHLRYVPDNVPRQSRPPVPEVASEGVPEMRARSHVHSLARSSGSNDIATRGNVVDRDSPMDLVMFDRTLGDRVTGSPGVRIRWGLVRKETKNQE